MALAAPTNPDLPSSWKVPGIYIKLNLTGSGAGLNSATKKLLLVGYKTSAGTQPADTAIQVTQQSDANTYFGAGSDVARMYAAAISQIGPGLCDVYCLGITAPSAGTASTHLITFTGTATASGGTDVYVCGYKHSVAIASGDTPTIIGANVAAALNLNTDLPVTAANGSGTVTLTYKVKGVVGQDLPTIVNMLGTTGVTASPGTLTYATNASSGGAITVTIGGTTISYTVTNADTPTVTATGVAAAINAGAYPVTATSNSGVVTLFYATDRVVHRIAASMGTITGTTVAVAAGTAGAGAPTLTTALSNLAGSSAYPLWATSFNDTASLGTMSTHIETYADGLNQKGQFLHAASTDPLATAGAIPAGTTPALTASPRYSFSWCPDAPQQAYEFAARTAAYVVIQDYHSKNYDGSPLTTRGTVPMLYPHKVVRAIPSDQNSAMYSYYMTPIVVDDSTGSLRILRGCTTSNSPDQRLSDWSWIRTFDYYRYDLGIFLGQRFGGKSLKVNGTPRTPNTINIASITDATYERMRTWDAADLFDDPDSLKTAITANQDPVVPTRVDLYVPLRPPVPLHQLGVVGGAV